MLKLALKEFKGKKIHEWENILFYKRNLRKHVKGEWNLE